MKHVIHGKRGWIIAAISLIIIVSLLGGVILRPQLNNSRQTEWSRDVVSNTNEANYSDLSQDDLQDRSKAVFGKTIDELEKSDIKKISQSDGVATTHEAAKLLAAGGKMEKSLQVFALAQAEQKPGEVNQDLYRDYRNTLDQAGRHSEATELMRKELEELKKQNPIDEIAVARVESQIEARVEYYK